VTPLTHWVLETASISQLTHTLPPMMTHATTVGLIFTVYIQWVSKGTVFTPLAKSLDPVAANGLAGTRILIMDTGILKIVERSVVIEIVRHGKLEHWKKKLTREAPLKK